MARRLLIGSSNVQRFFNPKKDKKHEGFRLEKCVRVEEFRVRMENVSPLNNLDSVTVSVIENFLCDAIGSDPDRETFDKKVEEVCKDFCETVTRCAKRSPNTLFLVVKPINRPKHKWFNETLEDISNYIGSQLKNCKLKNVIAIDCI